MTARKKVLVIASVMLIFFTSCRKDFNSSEDQLLQAEAATAAASANAVPETAPPVHTPIVTYVNANCAGFFQTLPARYGLTTKKYPLILFIHGIGELGTDIGSVNCCGLPYYVSRKQFPAEFVVNGVHHSFIVVSPQFKRRPTPAEIQSVINFAVKRYRVDQTRIYVTGLSMGGGSTWDYSAVYGQNAAAAVPICGGTAPTQALAKSIASKNLPVWTISSRGDKVVPVSWATNWISWIDAANSALAPKTKLTVWSTQSHNDTWFQAFNPTTRDGGKNIYEWMLQFTRNGAVSTPAPAPAPTPAPPASGNKPPNAVAGPDQILRFSTYNKRVLLNGLASTDPDGTTQAAYSWSLVNGPTGAYFTARSVGQVFCTFKTKGTYIFRLTVRDSRGGVDTDDLKITVI